MIKVKSTPAEKFANAGTKQADEYWKYKRGAGHGGDCVGYLSQYLGLDMNEPGSLELVDLFRDKLENKLTKGNYNWPEKR